MLKIKRLRTADCVVGGFRYENDSRQVGSLLLGLYDDAGKLDHVGFTSAISDAERAALTAKLERLAGGPGFTGDAPGGPSRWSNGRSADWTPLKTEAGGRGPLRPRHRRAASGTGPPCFAGGPTRRRGNAPWPSCARSLPACSARPCPPSH